MASVRQLRAPLYLHELVKRVHVLAMDGGDTHMRRASQLVSHLHKQGLLSDTVAKMGFARLVEAVDDLALDVPHAPAMLGCWLLEAVSTGILEQDFFDGNVPSSPRVGPSAPKVAINHHTATPPLLPAALLNGTRPCWLPARLPSSATCLRLTNSR